MIKLNDVPVVVKYFPNGESFADISLDMLNSKGNTIFFSYVSEKDMVMLRFICDFVVSHSYNGELLHLVLDSVPFTILDFNDIFQVTRLKTFCKCINSIKFNSVMVNIEPCRVSKSLFDRLI